jgi:hypothetical protein
MYKNVADITGQQFGRLTAIEHVGSNKHRFALWRCICECGSERTCISTNLRNGTTKSCGCLRKEITSRLHKGIKLIDHTTRDAHPHEFRTWKQILRRCGITGPGLPRYLELGVYNGWTKTFEVFLEYVLENLGPHPGNGWSVDRIDNEKGYIPGNIRWANATIQANNRRKGRYPKQRKVSLPYQHFTCECGMNTTAGPLAGHQRSTGHITPLSHRSPPPLARYSSVESS